MSNNLSEDQVKEALESGYGQSEALFTNKDELDNFLQRSELKIKEIPNIDKQLGVVIDFISLVKHFVEGKYIEIPYASILAILSSLIYFFSPIDIIPDFIPFVGYFDDEAVIELCMNMVNADIEAYNEWRRSQGLI